MISMTHGQVFRFKKERELRKTTHRIAASPSNSLCSARKRSKWGDNTPWLVPSPCREGTFCRGMEQVTRVSSTAKDKPDKVHLPQHQAISYQKLDQIADLQVFIAHDSTFPPVQWPLQRTGKRGEHAYMLNSYNPLSKRVTDIGGSKST